MVRRVVSRSEFARLGNSRIKSIQRRRDAEEMQPWRCAECNTPVRPGMGDPCKCIQAEEGADIMNNVTSINEPRNFVITSAPDPATLEPEFGIAPGSAKPLAYGARAIFKRDPKPYIDYVWDRQQLVGGTEEERKAFAAWMKRADFERIVREMVAEHDLYPSDAAQVVRFVDGIEIQISPKKSFGYLYIGAWPTEGMIAAEPSAPRPIKTNAIGGAHRGSRETKVKKPFLAVVIEPGKKPEVRDIGDAKLETIQALVGGYIEHVAFFPKPKYTVVVNEEGAINGMEFNRMRVVSKKNPMAGVHRLYGTIVLHKSKSMTKEEAEKLCEEWSK